jgi:hypothetical protein
MVAEFDLSICDGYLLNGELFSERLPKSPFLMLN